MNNVTPGQQERPREPESGLEAVHASRYDRSSYPEVYDHHQGLEVCPSHPYHDQGPEALPPNAHNYPYPVASAPHDGSQPQVYSAVGGHDEKAPESTHIGPIVAGGQNKASLWRRKRKTLIIAGIVVAVAVIAAAVVGGVLGSQATKSDGDDKMASSR